MAGELQPLDEKFKIVESDGRPTLYFIEWAQQRQIDITASITSEQFDQLLLAYLLAHQLQEGDGIALTPSGNLNDSPSISVRNGTGLDFDGMQNLKIADTAVTPGTYGDATNVGQFTVDQQGRITFAANVPISGGGGGGAWTTVKLATDYVNATTTFTLISDGVNSFSWIPPADSDIEIQVDILGQTIAAANLPKFQITIPGAANNVQYGFGWWEINTGTGSPIRFVDSFTTGGATINALSGSLPTSGEPWPYRAFVKLRTGSSPAAITFEGGAESAAANACTFKAGSSMNYRVV